MLPKNVAEMLDLPRPLCTAVWLLLCMYPLLAHGSTSSRFTTPGNGLYYVPDFGLELREKDDATRYVSFSVMAGHSAQLALLTNRVSSASALTAEEVEEAYRFNIGVSYNTRCSITSPRKKSAQVEFDCARPLNASRFSDMWVSVDTSSGRVAMGTGDAPTPESVTIEYKDVAALPPLQVAVSTSKGVIGVWRFAVAVSAAATCETSDSEVDAAESNAACKAPGVDGQSGLSTFSAPPDAAMGGRVNEHALVAAASMCAEKHNSSSGSSFSACTRASLYPGLTSVPKAQKVQYHHLLRNFTCAQQDGNTPPEETRRLSIQVSGCSPKGLRNASLASEVEEDCEVSRCSEEQFTFGTAGDRKYRAPNRRPRLSRKGSVHYVVIDIMAAGNAHVGLFPTAEVPSHMDGVAFYEFVVGGWENSRCMIRRKAQGEVLGETACEVLIDDDFVEMWFSVDEATGRVAMGFGREISTGTLLEVVEAQPPLLPRSVAVTTGGKIPGLWGFPPKCCLKALTSTCAEQRQSYSYDIDIIRSSPVTIGVVRDFASPEECEQVVRSGGSWQMMPEATTWTKTGQSLRRSFQGAFERNSGPLVARVSRRMFALVRELTGFDVRSPGQEPLQAVLYRRAGDEYGPHCDGGCANEPYSIGVRVATSLLVCRAAPLGGQTTFTRDALKVKPAEGDLLVFSYVVDTPGGRRMDPGRFTEHSGCPVLAGAKWVTTQWYREGVNSSFTWRKVKKAVGWR